MQGVEDVVNWIKKYALMETVDEPKLHR